MATKQCSYCGFNRRNRDESTAGNAAGGAHFCTIRDVPIPVAGWTFCENVLSQDPQPSGPIYSMGRWEPYYGGRYLPWWSYDKVPRPVRNVASKPDSTAQFVCSVCEEVFATGFSLVLETGEMAFCGNSCYLVAWKAAHTGERAPRSFERSYSAVEFEEAGNPTAPEDWSELAAKLSAKGKPTYADAALALANDMKR